MFKGRVSRLNWFAMLWKSSVHDLRFIKCQNLPVIKLCDWFSANIMSKTNKNDLTSRSVTQLDI